MSQSFQAVFHSRQDRGQGLGVLTIAAASCALQGRWRTLLCLTSTSFGPVRPGEACVGYGRQQEAAKTCVWSWRLHGRGSKLPRNKAQASLRTPKGTAHLAGFSTRSESSREVFPIIAPTAISAEPCILPSGSSVSGSATTAYSSLAWDSVSITAVISLRTFFD